MERARLIVKNFGPLKDIDIEVREMVCIIGKQASGKSTLAKLIAIFEDEKFITNQTSFESELKKLNLKSFIVKDTFITYKLFKEDVVLLNFKYQENKEFFISLISQITNLLYKKVDKAKFNDIADLIESLFPILKKVGYKVESFTEIVQACRRIGLNLDSYPKPIKDEILKIESPNLITDLRNLEKYITEKLKSYRVKTYGIIESIEILYSLFYVVLSFVYNNLKNDSIYIPSERNFLHLISSNIQGLINNKIQIPEFLLNVGQEYEKALNNIKLVPLSLIDKKLKYKREGSTSYIYHSESEKVNLLESASGLQSVIPILLLIEFMNSNKKEYNYNFIIEEPELNLYPETQHNLIKHLVANCLDDITQSKNLVLTTHSPYVLSSINNLLMAYKKGQEKSKEVQKIIKKKSWLDPNRFAAYEMRNGKAYSIVNKKLGLIKENMIDDVVEIFDNEFTRLLNL